MRVIRSICILHLLLGTADAVRSQDWENRDRLPIWLPLQAVPNATWYSSDASNAFGLEWEFTPLSYSFGINRHVSPWSSFIVIPTYRFSGSVELNIAGQLYTSPVASTRAGVSTTLMGYIPLIERGEHLTLNLGMAVHHVGGKTVLLRAGGISTLFGFLHLNIKQSSNPAIWITSLEFRFF